MGWFLTASIWEWPFARQCAKPFPCGHSFHPHSTIHDKGCCPHPHFVKWGNWGTQAEPLSNVLSVLRDFLTWMDSLFPYWRYTGQSGLAAPWDFCVIWGHDGVVLIFVGSVCVVILAASFTAFPPDILIPVGHVTLNAHPEAWCWPLAPGSWGLMQIQKGFCWGDRALPSPGLFPEQFWGRTKPGPVGLDPPLYSLLEQEGVWDQLAPCSPCAGGETEAQGGDASKITLPYGRGRRPWMYD